MLSAELGSSHLVARESAPSDARPKPGVAIHELRAEGVGLNDLPPTRALPRRRGELCSRPNPELTNPARGATPGPASPSVDPASKSTRTTDLAGGTLSLGQSRDRLLHHPAKSTL